MRYRLLLRAALAVLVLAVIILVVAPAHAQSVPAPTATSDVLSSILAAVLVAIPGLVIGAFAWFKAHAAQSAATWDDEAVAFVEKIAQGVVNATAAGRPAVTGAPAAAVPITGVDK